MYIMATESYILNSNESNIDESNINGLNEFEVLSSTYDKIFNVDRKMDNQ
jgi:hypothetical protein